MIGKHTATENVYFLDTQFPYAQFKRTKRIWIYLPTDYFHATTTNKTYSVVYMPDGQNLFDAHYNPNGLEWGVDETLDKFDEFWKLESDLLSNELAKNDDIYIIIFNVQCILSVIHEWS